MDNLLHMKWATHSNRHGNIFAVVLLILLVQTDLLYARPLGQDETRIVSVAWSPDGTKLAVSGGPSVCDNADLSLYDVKIIDPATNQTLVIIPGNRCYVGSLDWSPDGSKLIGTTLRVAPIWNALTGQLVHDNIRGQGFVSARWMPDGNSVLVTDVGGGILKLDSNTGEFISGFYDLLGSVIDLNPSGSQVVAGKFRDQVIRIADITTGQLVLSLIGHSAGISAVDWSSDGSKIASGSDDGNVRVWNADTGEQLLSLSAHTGYVTSIAWNPDNRLLATTGVDGKLRIWDTTTEEVVCQISTEGFIYDSAWNPDGTVVAYGGAASTVGLVLPFPNVDTETSGQTSDNADFGTCATATTTRPLASDGEGLPLIPSPSEMSSTLVPSPEVTP
jgi:WD40 repeat protein